MNITRRGLIAGTGTLIYAGSGRRVRAADAEPIRIGCLMALTGASSAPSNGCNRGVLLAAETINAAGGVKGRKIEIVTRDTQGDPTKAVNATQEMINSVKADTIFGPLNSGEALATTSIMARANIPDMHTCVVDSLIDAKKFPSAFRNAPSVGQWDDAVRAYTLKVLGVRKVAVLGDTTGAGVSIAKTSAANFKSDGAEVVYFATIDATQPDLTPDMLRARSGDAEAIVVWSVSTGLMARLLNTRAAMGWDVPVLGHPSLSSGEIAKLIDKPENWKKCYAVGYRSCSYDKNGKLPERSQKFVAMLKGKVDLSDTLLWWVAVGYDSVQLVADAVEHTGSTDHKAIIDYWNSLRRYPGYFGDYTWTADDHNGYPLQDIVMSDASTARDGAFNLAPGYA